jgi:DNA invertase Pin-like site-specific DNA recombinase
MTKARLTDEQVKEITDWVVKGYRYSVICKRFGCGKSTVSRIKTELDRAKQQTAV